MPKAELHATDEQEFINRALTEWASLTSQIAPQLNRIRQLEEQIEKTLKTVSVDSDGNSQSLSLETDSAKVAVMVAKVRSVDPKRFITSVAEANRGPAFWECLSVGAARAEKFLPLDVFQSLAEVNTEIRIKMSLKAPF